MGESRPMMKESEDLEMRRRVWFLPPLIVVR